MCVKSTGQSDHTQRKYKNVSIRSGYREDDYIYQSMITIIFISFHFIYLQTI